MIKSSKLFLVAALLSSTSTIAADNNGLFAIRGAGLLTCATFVKERAARSEVYTMIGGWLDGYVTAINELSQETFDIAPHESTELLTILIDRHCATNPGDTLYAVTNTLLARLYDDRLTTSSPYADIAIGLKQMRLYRATIVRVQEELVAKNFLASSNDGVWNQATTIALTKYQDSIGFEATGFPDQATLWRLLQSSDQ